MTRSMVVMIRLSAVMALVLLTAPLMTERAEALTRPGPTFEALATETLTGAPATVILVGSTRSRNAARARGFRQPHQLHGRTHAKRTQKFVFQGAKRFNLPRQFRGLRDFGSSVNTRLLRRDEAEQNPRIILNRNPSFLYNRPLATGKLITAIPPSAPEGFTAAPEEDSPVLVLRGGEPVRQAAQPKTEGEPAKEKAEKGSSTTAPAREYDFSAY